jgi:putative hydrolase of the HAD superfamily
VPETRAVVSDFGGVLTSPLQAAFLAVQDGLDIPIEAYGDAMARATEPGGELPLFALERGAITEADFLARLEGGLAEVLDRPVSLHGFGERLMAALHPNEELFAYYRGLRDRGVRLALLTNNVREWEPLWRPKLPVDDVFELVVDSAFVGMRKPEPEIYALTLERLGVPAEACVFVDDLEINVDAARSAGMQGIVYRDTAQAIAELDAQFSQPSRSQQ